MEFIKHLVQQEATIEKINLIYN